MNLSLPLTNIMANIRTFIAIEFYQHYRQKITDLISLLKKSSADVRWITENQIHLTLKFLGSTQQENIPKISDILKAISSNYPTFNITFSKISAFPNMHSPKVIWLGIDKGAEDLKFLNSKIETDLEKLGIKKEKREYNAHLTLGRVKSPKNILQLTRLLDETAFQLQDEIRIDKLILFQSRLTPQGAIYTPIQFSLFYTSL